MSSHTKKSSGSRKGSKKSGSRKGSKKSGSRKSSKKSGSRKSGSRKGSCKGSRKGTKGSKSIVQSGGASLSGQRFGGNVDLFGNIDVPILTFYSLDGCPYCNDFNAVWDQLVLNDAINSQILFNKIETYAPFKLVPNPYVDRYPSLVVRDSNTFDYVMLDNGVSKTTDNVIQWLQELNVLKLKNKIADGIANDYAKVLGI